MKIWLVESIQSIYMINVISAADIAFIMSSSTSAWLLSSWSVLLRNKMAERFTSVSEDELCEKCIINKTIIEFGPCMISWIIKTSCLCYLPWPSASADNTDSVLIIHDIIYAQLHPIIFYYLSSLNSSKCMDLTVKSRFFFEKQIYSN